MEKEVLIEKLRALQEAGLTLVDVAKVFGVSSEHNAYAAAAKKYVEPDWLELDDQVFLSDPGDGTGSWVSMWRWITQEEALAGGYQGGGVRITEALERLQSACTNAEWGVVTQQEKGLIAEYLVWLEDTLANFGDEIDELEFQKEVKEANDVPLSWVAEDGSTIHFRPSGRRSSRYWCSLSNGKPTLSV